jgi:HEAT repeat protein
MKKLSFLLLLPLLATLIRSQEKVTSSQAKPDAELSAPAVRLSAAERERLLQFTKRAVPEQETRAAESADTRAAASRPGTDIVAEIEELEALLAKASASDSPETSRMMLELLDSPTVGVRLTVLHRLISRQDVAATAIARALGDGDKLVQSAAAQMLFDRGVSQDAVDELKALESEGERRARVAPLLSQSESK